MWKRISDGLYRISGGWVTLAALVIFVLFAILVLPGQAASSNTDAEDVGSPDLSFVYSTEDLYRMAEAYGEQGRQAYIRARLTFDVIWPLVYTFFLSTATSWVFARVFAPTSRWRLANLAPVLGALFDFAENLSTSLVMFRYPARTAVVDMLAPIFTPIKWIFVNGSFLLLLAGVIAGMWQLIKTRGKE